MATATVNLVKVKLEGHLRIMQIPAPPRFDALVEAVKHAYGMAEAAGITFTYNDADGDQVCDFCSNFMCGQCQYK